MVVTDASVAAKWLFPEEEHAGLAVRLLDDETTGTELIVAPPLLKGEITNVLRQRMRRESLSLATADSLLAEFLELRVMIVSPPGLEREALQLAAEFALPAAYDAHYVVLARMLRCDLWTADQRLLHSVAPRLPYVRWIGDYSG